VIAAAPNGASRGLSYASDAIVHQLDIDALGRVGDHEFVAGDLECAS
jgi:hypothetical protein